MIGPMEINEKVQVSVRLLSENEQTSAKQWKRAQYVALEGILGQPDQARNEGAFDYRRYLKFQHIHWQLRSKGLASAQVVESRWNTFHLMRYVDQSRTFLAGKLDRLYPEPDAGFMKGILLGLRDAMDPEQYQQFSLLGLTHIIAISGLNVGIFVFLCFLGLRWLRFTFETNTMIVIWLIPFYILLTGASPSVVRAGLMAMIALWAARRKRLKNGLTLVSIVALLMVAWNPYYVFDIGFQLSFLVTIGLLAGVPYFNRLLPIRQTWLKNAISVTTVAQWVAFPLTIYYFNQFSILSWVANLALVPYVSLLIYPLALVSLLVALLSEQAAQFFAQIVIWLDRGLFWTIEYFSGFQKMLLIIPSPSEWWLVAYYSLGIVIIACLLRRQQLLNPIIPIEQVNAFAAFVPAINPAYARHNLVYSMFAGLLLVGLLLHAYWPLNFNHQGTVSFIDVGQGDAILIKSPTRKHILIDGGGTITFGKKEAWAERRNPFEIGKNVLVPLLKKRGVQQIDLLIVSHQDADHIGGLVAVIEQIPVKRLLFNGTLKPSQHATSLFQLALAKGVALHEIAMGEQIRVDDETVLDILAPMVQSETNNISTIEQSDLQNQLSVVTLLKMFDQRFLFTGDIDQANERKIVAKLAQSSFAVPTIQVLKVAHHGSNSSTHDDWLRYWQPQQAVISAGRNNIYRHPHPKVLQRLEQAGTQVWRTDLVGEITFTVTEDDLRARSTLSH